MRRRREEIESELADLVKCSICQRNISPWDKVAKTATFRGLTYEICGRCDRKYSHAPEQIAWSGFKFRFVERREIPPNRSKRNPQHKEIYKILLLFKERQEIRKEVKWMADQKTKDYMRSPRDALKIIRQTAVCLGDDYKLADDEALMMLKDMLEERFPEIVAELNREQNRSHKKKKRLT